MKLKNPETLRRNIEFAIKAKRIKKNELAEQAKIASSTLYNFLREGGTPTISDRMRETIALALEVSEDDLLIEHDEGYWYRRFAPESPYSTLSNDQRELIDIFDRLPNDKKKMLVVYAEFLETLTS